MGDKTGISWTDSTWNPIRGCSRVSAGCTNCYAEAVANRFSGEGQPYAGLVNVHGRWNGIVRPVPEHLADPLRWKRPRRIFVNSMSDLFHEALTNEQIAAVFDVMAACPRHTFQVLTKRPKRMREWFVWVAMQPGAVNACVGIAEGQIVDRVGKLTALVASAYGRATWPLPNVWIGVSVENQEAADERIPELLETPAAVRYLSCEPLIGPVNLGGVAGLPSDDEDVRIDALRGTWSTPRSEEGTPIGSRIDWVIAGCESGPGARACDVGWFRWLRDQCAGASVPFFLKQAVALTTSRAVYPSAQAARVETVHVAAGDGSKAKAGGVIELPYLDGVQHTAFPGGAR